MAALPWEQRLLGRSTTEHKSEQGGQGTMKIKNEVGTIILNLIREMFITLFNYNKSIHLKVMGFPSF